MMLNDDNIRTCDVGSCTAYKLCNDKEGVFDEMMQAEDRRMACCLHTPKHTFFDEQYIFPFLLWTPRHPPSLLRLFSSIA
jgi:hypothetical protein